MATTQKLIQYATKRQAKGYSTEEVRDLLNEAQNLLYKHECAQTLLIDATTGDLPLLTTVNNTFQYNGPANTWRVGNLLLKDLEDLSDYELENIPGVNTEDYVEIRGYHYYPYFEVSTEDALEGALPIITFSTNPRNTTDRYYIQAYKLPTQITSNRIQLTIPDSDGAHMGIVFPALMKLIEGQNHGKYDEAVEYIDRIYKPKLWRILNKGAQGARHRVQSRPY